MPLSEADVGELKTKLRVARECLVIVKEYINNPSMYNDEAYSQTVYEDVDLTIRYMDGDNV